MSKTVVALVGSPRKRGATGMLSEAAIKGLEATGIQVELIYANSLQINPCNGCNHCLKLNKCIFQDDMGRIHQSFLKADGFLISSPVYFGSVTAQLKTIIDRCQVFWAIKKNKKGLPSVDKWRPLVFLATAGMDDKKGTRFTGSLEVIENLSQVLDLKMLETVLIANTDRVPLLENSPEIEQAYQAGGLLAEQLLSDG